MDKFESAVKYLIKTKAKTLADLDSAKRDICKKFQITSPSNINLLKAYHSLLKKKRIKKSHNLECLLRKRRVRSLSGIVNVSVLTKPYNCPGKCIFCPSQKGIPKSYLAKEPAVQRAVLTDFDPKKQIKARLEALKMTGHPTDKIELRIIGGTWSYYPKRYQTWFATQCFAACNNSKKAKSLETEHKKNEKTKHKIIGLTIETRPDYIDLKEIKRLRKLGVTRVELGVQSIYDDVLRLNKRGHTIKETIKATELLKNAGFKVSYQIMPNLPGSTFKKDIKMFRELFSNSDFQPDLLKIYPLGLVKNTLLYRWYKQKKFKPYNKKKLIKLLTEIKKQIPCYARIERVIRDIPSADIVEGGVKTSNLRELTQRNLTELGLKCKCIRCREVKEDYDFKEKLHLFKEEYNASGGSEIFLSFESKNKTKLYALLRLRILKFNEAGPRQILPVLKDCAIVREIHVYGQTIPILKRQSQAQTQGRGPTSALAVQHKGLGKRLMKEAENIARKNGFDKIAVIAGIGARGYYRKLGYKLKDTYMIKNLNS